MTKGINQSFNQSEMTLFFNKGWHEQASVYLNGLSNGGKMSGALQTRLVEEVLLLDTLKPFQSGPQSTKTIRIMWGVLKNADPCVPDLPH